MLNTKRLSFLTTAAALGAIAVAVPTAKADVTIDITAPNSAISGNPGPYGTVNVHLTDPTHATITFTSLTNSGNIYLFGDGGSVAVNVNATSFTLGTISGSNAGTGFTPGPYSDGGAGNEDGFGSFNQTINSFDGFTHSSDTISFTLTDNSGTWASASSVLALNSNGAEVAAHIFVTSSPANVHNGAIVTGFAAGGPGNIIIQTPEPTSLALLGTALAGLGFLSRRRRRSAA